MTLKPIVVTALTAALAVAGVPPAGACSCLPDERPTDLVRRDHAAVFVGSVVDVAKVVRDGASGLAREDVEVTFRVERAWKGIRADEAVVTTAATGALCGYGFESGRTYLVWARRDGARLVVSLCSRTQPLDAAAAEVARLGAPDYVSKR